MLYYMTVLFSESINVVRGFAQETNKKMNESKGFPVSNITVIHTVKWLLATTCSYN